MHVNQDQEHRKPPHTSRINWPALTMALLFCLAATVSAYQYLLVLTSTQTPGEMAGLLRPEAAVTWLPADLRLLQADVNDITKPEVTASPALAVVDATFGAVHRELIAGLCLELQIPQVAVGYSHSSESPQLYTVSPSYEHLAQALQSLALSFNWTRITLAADSSPASTAISTSLKTGVNPACSAVNFYLQDDASVDRLVGRNLLSMGNRVTAFLTHAELSGKIENSQKNRGMRGAGFANVLLLSSALSREWVAGDGDLIVVEEGMESVSGVTEFYRRLLETVGKLASNCSDSQSLAERLQYFYPSHFPPQVFSLINVQSGRRVIVGRLVNGGVTLNDTLYFLGNSSIVPQNGKSPLQISGNFGVRNGNNVYLLSQNYYRGAILAIRDVNAREDLLPNFDIELFNFSAGVQVWNYSFAYENVYPHRDRLGLALLTSSSSALTVSLYSFLRELNYTGAVIGASNTVDALSSTTQFPVFLRTIQPDKFLIEVYVQMFKRFGWKNCALFVSNETWGLNYQARFTSLAAQNNITVLNAAKYQVLPTPIPTLDTLRNYTANFLDFLKCKAKILVIAVNNNAVLIVDFLYELGVRAGEVQFVANEWLTMSYVAAEDPEVRRRRSVLLRGAIQFSPLGFVGSFGQQVKADYTAEYGVTPPLYACFYYDAVLTIAYGFDTVVALGEDHMDPKVVERTMRGEKFKGCTGVVAFHLETNDRTLMRYTIQNAQFGNSSEEVTSIVSVGTYEPTSAVLFQFYADVIWNDGTTNVPSDLQTSSIGCPFEDKYNLEFADGRKLTYELSGGYFALTLLFTLFVWRKWWHSPHAPLSEPREIQPLDVFAYVGLAIDTLQYLALGPTLSFLPQQVTLAIDASALDVRALRRYQDGGFERVWIGTFAVFAVWGVMTLVVFFSLDKVCKKLPGVGTLGDVSEAVLPAISDVFFVPMLAVLASVYTCVRGVGVSSVSYLDSYLEFDCFLPCWQGAHLRYTICTSVALFLFTPVCIFSRPLWQELQEHINIKSSGTHLMAKSIVQVAAVLLSKTVRERYPKAHSISFLSVFAVFTLWCWKTESHTYQRASLWQRVSLLVVVWTAMLGTASKFTAIDPNALLLLAVAGWVLIVLAGCIYQRLKLPSLLYKKEGMDLRWLFRFAFKPTNLYIVKALQDTFQSAGHRNTINLPSCPVATERRANTEADDPATATLPKEVKSEV